MTKSTRERLSGCLLQRVMCSAIQSSRSIRTIVRLSIKYAILSLYIYVHRAWSYQWRSYTRVSKQGLGEVDAFSVPFDVNTPLYGIATPRNCIKKKSGDWYHFFCFGSVENQTILKAYFCSLKCIITICTTLHYYSI